MNLVFLLAACTDSLVDSFPYKYMLCLSTISIEPSMGKLILNHLIEIRNALYLFKLTLRSNCLELCFLDSRFENHLDSVILQNHQPFSNQSFKRNSVHMPSLNLIPKLSFEPRFRMFIIKKKQTLVVLGLLIFFESVTQVKISRNCKVGIIMYY